MKKNIAVIIILISLIFGCKKDNLLIKDNFKTIGRGEVKWKANSVLLKDNYVYSDKFLENGAYEFSFKVKPTTTEKEIQMWSGFGFSDRDNRYALGVRGGNNNDIYLSKYQDNARSNLLALEPLDFKPNPNEWHQIKVVFFNGNIRMYLNDENKPRIVVQDDEPLTKPNIVLGGGWTKNEYKEFVINALTEEKIASYKNDSLKYVRVTTVEEKEQKRKKERAVYTSKKIQKLKDGTQKISLNGNWLFMPEKSINDVKQINTKEYSDDNWHIMPVPATWTPVKNWMHGFDRGVSDNFERKEQNRCEGFTFDYKNVKSAYYRHWVHLPENINTKNTFLEFLAVAKIAKVWVNGNYIGSHIGTFGNFKFDVSKYIAPGENLITLKVDDDLSEKAADGDEVEEVAITVEVTKDMLNSLPRGMHNPGIAGIWQDVQLIVADKIHIEDVFVNTKLQGATINIDLANSGKSKDITVQTSIYEKDKKGTPLYQSKNVTKKLSENTTDNINLSVSDINPKLWSPEDPNIYTLQIDILEGETIIDTHKETIGFRTIETIGNKFFLNGKPYWLRGANHPPIGIAPNDTILANKFLQLMHTNNQMVTRTHGTAITKAWADAADKQGVGISLEGTWPWVMLGKEIPSSYLLGLWKEEMLSLVRKYKNHPSILFWTVSNESYFTNSYSSDAASGLRLKKWKIMSDLIKEIRKIDPTRPISATSGYIRVQSDYENVLKPAGIDDGDFDDSHNSYFGWYNPDHYFLYDGKWTKELYLSTGANKNRPFISQELSSGYPNNDSGHPTRDYIFDHYVPQAWVGDWAYEDHNPNYYLKRNAFLTKEIGETIRRTGIGAAGVMHFANICWFRNAYDANTIENYPVVSAMKKALSPVLVSAELYGRNFFSGDSLNTKIAIINDSEDGQSLDNGKLVWEVIYEDKVLSTGNIATEEVEHYERLWKNIKVQLPQKLPVPKAQCELRLTLQIDSKTITQNSYDLNICQTEWVIDESKQVNGVELFDATGQSKKVLETLKIDYKELKTLDSINGNLLIVANIDDKVLTSKEQSQIKTFISKGGKTLFLHAGKQLLSLFPEKVESILDKPGRVVNMHVPESPVFNDIKPMELSWWHSDNKTGYPQACKRSYRLKDIASSDKLVTFIEVHGYVGGDRGKRLNDLSGVPLAQFNYGKGSVIISEMEFNMGWKDPIAARVLMNNIIALHIK